MEKAQNAIEIYQLRVVLRETSPHLWRRLTERQLHCRQDLRLRAKNSILRGMITKKQYVEYLVSTPKNCTCTYLAEHLEDVSHDVVNDFLHQKRFLPREVWKLVKDRIEDSKEAFLLVDDSVQDKRYSRFIELVRAQYSGNEHRVIKGIGVVNLVHSAGKDADFYPIDYRVYAPDVDGKTKNDHFQEMFVNALDQKHLHARTILFDGWYASAENLKLIHRRKRIFFTTLKSNRLVSLSKEAGLCPSGGDRVDAGPTGPRGPGQVEGSPVSGAVIQAGRPRRRH